MKFKVTGFTNDVARGLSLSEVVLYSVQNASYDTPGQIETVSAELCRLVEIVGAICDVLPDDVQCAIARTCFNVEEDA